MDNLLSYVMQGKYQGDTLHLVPGEKHPQPFGNPLFKGAQLKGPVFILDQEQVDNRFLKLDTISKRHGDNFYLQAEYDVSYSSVVESIVSCFVESMVADADFPCLTYRFEKVIPKVNAQPITGTSSPNYVRTGCLESVLTDRSAMAFEKYLVEYDEFEQAIKNKSENQAILSSMIAFFTRFGLSEQAAKAFIVKQAAFDLLLGNEDRKGNSTNFVFLVGFENVQPYNMDFGRCLRIPDWKEQMEQAMQRFQGTAEWQEIIVDFKDQIKQSHQLGILGNDSYAKNIDFLFEHGFQPFQIDFGLLQEKLNHCVARIQTLEPKLATFAQAKADLLLALLADTDAKRLWEEVR